MNPGSHRDAAPARAPELSVVVPALDEAAALPRFWARLAPVLDGLPVTTEVVLVNDGSADDTLAVMRALQCRDGRVRVVDLTRRFGHQAAVLAGLAHARGEAAVVLDADLQDPPEVMGEMVARWQEGFEVIYGVRRCRKTDSWFKRVSARGFYAGLGLLSGGEVRSDVGDFALVTRPVIEVLCEGRAPRPFLRGQVARAGFRHTGVSYDRAPRIAGRTKYPLHKMFALATDALVTMSWAPLRLATLLGLTGIVAGASWMVLGTELVPGLVVTLAGVQLVSVGLLGEYVGRVHDAVTRRPVYLVRDVLEPTSPMELENSG